MSRCGHDTCLFQRTCLVVQAEFELFEAREDRARRRERGRSLASAVGLGDAEGELFEVVLYSSELPLRIRAAELLCVALDRVAKRAA